LWDDSPEARAKAEAEGFACTDLMKHGAFEGVACLVTSPGIPHLYPSPNKVIARAMELGVPVDNDIGLFFQSLATKGWDDFDTPPRVVCITGSNRHHRHQRQIHHHGAGASYLAGVRAAHADGGEYRARCAGY